MKIILILILLMASPVFATDLVCDPQPGVVSYDIELNGVIIATDYPAEADGSIKYNVDAFNPGNYTFRGRVKSAEGWPSDWSDPFVATKPGGIGGLRIK